MEHSLSALFRRKGVAQRRPSCAPEECHLVASCLANFSSLCDPRSAQRSRGMSHCKHAAWADTQPNKTYPSDWQNPGRVKVQFVKDGRFFNPIVKNSELHSRVLEPLLKRQELSCIPNSRPKSATNTLRSLTLRRPNRPPQNPLQQTRQRPNPLRSAAVPCPNPHIVCRAHH